MTVLNEKVGYKKTHAQVDLKKGSGVELQTGKVGAEGNVVVPSPVKKTAIRPGDEGKGEDNPMQGSTGENTPENEKVKKIATFSGKGVKSDKSSEKPIMQGSSASLYKSVTREDVDLSDDIDALFEGTDLSEEVKEKITTIFETAVVSKINEQLELFSQEAESEIAVTQSTLEEEMSEKLDNYLDHVVEHWLEENKLAVEVGLKSQILENFMKGLHTLFTENYIEVPENKTDVVDELVSRIEKLETELNDQIHENVQLKKEVGEFERELVFAEVTEGLTETQIAKLESLSESVEFEDVESFTEKLATLRENYFPNKSAAKSLNESVELDSDPIDSDNEEEKAMDPAMRAYSAVISRTIKK